MNNWKKMTVLLLCLVLLCAPVQAAETEENMTLPPIYVGVQEMGELPGNWNPLTAESADATALLALTSRPLYGTDTEGALIPIQAAAMPQDVTAEFAGQFGIPAGATRAYAYEIDLADSLYWDDGRPITIADWSDTLEQLVHMGRFGLKIANYDAYCRGDTAPATEVISLMEAGYGSLVEARNAGYQDLYIDTTYFWGLDTGWFRVTDRTRLLDTAIPSGCEEMYITPAYLFRTYLGENGSQQQFQSEFLGIPVTPGPAVTAEEVGLFVREDRLVVILEEPTAASTLALALKDLYPVPAGSGDSYGTAADYRGCGPYRILSATGSEITLEPNPYWQGEPVTYARIRCVTAG